MRIVKLTRTLILLIIYKYKPHGYELMKIIRELTGGLLQPGPGTIYPILFLLKSQGLIREIQSNDRRKRYEITEKGIKQLEEFLPKMRKIMENILDLIDYVQEDIEKTKQTQK